MKNQLAKIKYIPDLFPDLDFTSEIIIKSAYKEIPPVISSAMTQNPWANFDDFVKIQRKIQSVIEKRYSFEFYTLEEVDYSLLQVAENCEIRTDDDRVFSAYDIEIKFDEEKKFAENKITIKFSVKEEKRVVNHLASDIWSDSEYSNLAVNINNPVYNFYATVGLSGAGGSYVLVLPNENEFSNLEVEDKLYWHSDISDFNNAKENIGLAEVAIKNSTQIVIYLNVTGLTTAEYSGFFTLNNIPDVDDSTTIISAMEYQINTNLTPKTKIEIGENSVSNPNDNLKIYNKLNVQEKLELNLYLKKSEIWKLKYLAFADSLIFTDNNNSETYHIQQIPESFTISDRKDLIDLFEIKFLGIISNLNSKQLY